MHKVRAFGSYVLGPEFCRELKPSPPPHLTRPNGKCHVYPKEATEETDIEWGGGEWAMFLFVFLNTHLWLLCYSACC